MRKLIDKLMDRLVPERAKLREMTERFEVSCFQLTRAINAMTPRQRKKYFQGLAKAGLGILDMHGVDVEMLDLRIQ